MWNLRRVKYNLYLREGQVIFENPLIGQIVKTEAITTTINDNKIIRYQGETTRNDRNLKIRERKE